MNKPATACLWAASILTTYLIVREPPNDPIIDRPAPVRTSRSSARVAERPALPLRAELEVLADDRTFLEVRATLERDLADGRWGIEDRDRLNAGLLAVTGPQAAELYDVLFPKLNDGTVKSDIAGPPL